MAGEVIYMTGQQLQAAVQAANQAVSGMTFAEAAAALGGSAQSQAGGAQITAFPLNFQEYGQVSTEAMYASQLWEYWKIAGEAAGTTALGAAAASAVSWAQGALIGTGEGLAATAGLLTLSVPTAVAMAAPLLGVGLGAALYESNPQFWNKIADGLVDFVTEGTQTVSALIDEAGHVLLDSKFIQKLKGIFEEEGIGQSSSAVSTDAQYSYYETSYYAPTTNMGTDSSGPFVYETIGGEGSVIARTSNGSAFIFSLDSGVYYTYRVSNTESGAVITNTRYQIANRIKISRTNQTVYYGTRNVVGSNIEPSNVDYTDILADIVLNGNSVSGGYPEGTSSWSNSQWNPTSSTTYPAVPVYDPSTGDTRPYYPVTPYIGDNPGTTIDPETTPQPDPTTPIPSWDPIVPYIPPVINPEIQLPDTPEFSDMDPGELTNPGAKDDPVYIPTPDLNPALNPNLDPSVESNPLSDSAPQSSGTSPDIIFPPVGVPFPSIMPAGSEEPVESGEPGFIQVYNPTSGEFVAFGRWLWVTYADATLDKIWNNPFDGVIGAHELYATPSKDGYSTIRSGFLDSGISSIIVRQRYTQINCGSILIPEYWGNYLDYSPYSRAYIYLPFIGIMEVDVDDIVGHAVNVLYHVDSYTGSCIAQITVAKDGYSNTVYQFTGNCSVEIPMSGGSQASIRAGMIAADAYQSAARMSAGMSLIGGLGSLIGGALGMGGGIGGALSGLSSAASQYAYAGAAHTAAMVSQKSNVQHSGSFGASHGAMGIKRPYIIIRRPIQKVVNNYHKLYGYPAHKMVIIGNCTGYLRCREVNVQSTLASDEEKSMIENLLKTGVYVTE